MLTDCLFWLILTDWLFDIEKRKKRWYIIPPQQLTNIRYRIAHRITQKEDDWLQIIDPLEFLMMFLLITGFLIFYIEVRSTCFTLLKLDAVRYIIFYVEGKWTVTIIKLMIKELVHLSFLLVVVCGRLDVVSHFVLSFGRRVDSYWNIKLISTLYKITIVSNMTKGNSLNTFLFRT